MYICLDTNFAEIGVIAFSTWFARLALNLQMDNSSIETFDKSNYIIISENFYFNLPNPSLRESNKIGSSEMRCLNASYEEWFQVIAWGVFRLNVKSHQTLWIDSVEIQLNTIKMMFWELFQDVRNIACDLAFHSANLGTYFWWKTLSSSNNVIALYQNHSICEILCCTQQHSTVQLSLSNR